jgi:hypothetical protein
MALRVLTSSSRAQLSSDALPVMRHSDKLGFPDKSMPKADSRFISLVEFASAGDLDGASK